MITHAKVQRMVTYLTAHCEQHLFECPVCNPSRQQSCDLMLTLLKLRVKWIRRGLEVQA